MSTTTARHRFISEMGEHEELDQVFLVTEKQLRPNRQGNLYLQLRLADRTGNVVAMMWNAKDVDYQRVPGGGYLRVNGTTQFYNGQLQILAKQIANVPAEQVDASLFQTIAPDALAAYANNVRSKLEAVSSLELRQLLQVLLETQGLFERFCAAPAALRHHHAYPGGLLQHVSQLMDLADSVCAHYPTVDRDLVRAGVFLHDLGKIEELSWEQSCGYTDVGQLVGHPVLGVSILERALAAYVARHGQPVSAELVGQLQHLIVSHHGRLEFGSPKVPMTLEALVLSYLDDLDAKLHQFQQLMESDMNDDSRWTVYHAQLGRKLFKAPRRGTDSLHGAPE